MFCAKCGIEAGQNGSFCQSCGKPLSASAPASPLNSIPGVPSFQTNPSAFPLGIDAMSPPFMIASNAPRAMKFIEAVKFGYQNYANFKGRASRSEYWFWMLHYWIVAVWLGLVSYVPVILSISDMPIPLGTFFSLGVFVPSIARATRRLHDINKPGALILLGLIPIVGSILLIVWLSKKGDAGANRYGPAQLVDVNSINYFETDAGTPVINNDLLENGAVEVKKKSLLPKYSFFAVIATLLVLLLAVLQSHVQFGKLISAIEVSEAQMNEFNAEEQKVYDRTTYGAPLKFNSAESEIVFESEVKRLAGVYEPRILNAGRIVDNILLLPWNFKQRDIKSSYLNHNSSWQKQLFTKSSDPYSTMYSDDIYSTWTDFCKELKSGALWYLFGRFDSRIAEICISDSDPDLSN
jgi:uncharacterized membrane protein YhaH (DUF805 family)